MRFPAPPGYEGRPPREWPIPPMDHRPGWKESALSDEMGNLVLARIAAGETVRQVTADPRMPSYATVYQWTRVNEAFAEAWYAVRRELARKAQVRDLEKRAGRAAAQAARVALGLKRARSGGRRSSYTHAKGKAVCARIARGASLSEVVREPGMPSFKVAYAWMRTHPAFRRMYVDACQRRLDGLEFERQLVVDTVEHPGAMAAADKALARIEGRMGRTLPKKYRVLA